MENSEDIIQKLILVVTCGGFSMGAHEHEIPRLIKETYNLLIVSKNKQKLLI